MDEQSGRLTHYGKGVTGLISTIFSLNDILSKIDKKLDKHRRSMAKLDKALAVQSEILKKLPERIELHILRAKDGQDGG